MQDRSAPKNSLKKSAMPAIRENSFVNLLFSLLVPVVTLFFTEWVARGTLEPNEQGTGFFEALSAHSPSFLIAFLFWLFLYSFITYLTGLHVVGVVVLGLFGLVPAVVTYFKMNLRNEPFLPWDIAQIKDLMSIQSEVELKPTVPMFVAIGVYIVLAGLAVFIRLPRRSPGRNNTLARFGAAGVALVLTLGMLFGVFLNVGIHPKMGIYEDMWMQDRYYRNHGVLTGFLTNLPVMQIDVPNGYSEDAVNELTTALQEKGGEPPAYAASPAANGENLAETPDIIFLMGESFWDVTALPGIAYDRELLPNLTALKAESAYGTAFTPSYGGGTCDVEFEALTGFSMENLPAGSKPYQQYVTDDTFSLAQVLKSRGYQTTAVHGYGRRFWNRDVAYPRLGIDTFVASDNFVDPLLRRGFISDEAMVSRILEELNSNEANGQPQFIHAVSMQNHTTYDPGRYPADELVRVTQKPDSIDDDLAGQLEDCATGIYEMDKALGRLVAALRERSRPTILVFWGDHMNPMNDGLSLFKKTGYISEAEDSNSPKLHSTPLLMWSNQTTTPVTLGTLSTYEISPVMMDLYGLQKPLYFSFLAQQLGVLHGRTRGVTINPDGSTTADISEAQKNSLHGQAVLQYDLLFGDQYLKNAENSGEAVHHG